VPAECDTVDLRLDPATLVVPGHVRLLAVKWRRLYVVPDDGTWGVGSATGTVARCTRGEVVLPPIARRDEPDTS